MVLCDFTDENGTIVSNRANSALLKKSVKLLDIGQRELFLDVDFFKEKVIDCSDERTFVINGVEKRIMLPTEALGVESVNVIKNEGDNLQNDVAIIKNGFVSLPVWFEGKIMLSYKSAPTKLTSETSIFSMNDNAIMLTLPYFLAANFLIEENPEKASYYLGLYNENKQKLKSVVAYKSIEMIEDIYN
jgi:hypothetical protein